jgi:NAD(P)-dependent dehydrogenase (short-subunit alcohol dehydrogenase family)
MKTALVFGAAGGIGRAIVQTLSQRDVRVLGVARDESRVEGATATSADLARESDVAAACLWAAQQAGQVDALVFAAGGMFSAPLASTSADELTRVFADNVFAAQHVLRHAAPLLHEGSHRVLLGAYPDKLHFPKLGAYAMAKAAFDAWARVLLKEERPVKTTLLRLPAVDTPFWKKAPFPLPKGALSASTVAEAVMAVLTEGKTGVVDL